MNTQLNDIGLLVVVLTAVVGIFALAIARNSRPEVAIKPWAEALIGWLFFALIGVGAWAVGELGVVVRGWTGTPLRIAVILAVLFAARKIWRVRSGSDLWGIAGVMLLAAGLSVLYRANGDGQMIGLGAVCLVAARLVQGREWALLQARSREAVVRRLSHALRTPTAAIRSLADALAAGAVEDPAERTRFIALIQAEAERLGVGLDRVLRVARGGDADALTPVPLDLAAWSEAVAERWRTRMPALEVSAEKHVVADVDPERLDEAVDALLDNAMRYGGGRVTLGIARVGDRVEISVEDDGAGPGEPVRAWLAAHSEEPLDPATARGFGLGLWAVGQVARAHGGRFALTDRSRFVLSLPVSG